MAYERADRTDASVAAVVDFLEGIQYPCSKEEIIDYVIRQDAPIMVVDALRRLPEEQYYDLAHVIDRFSRVSP
ncbi:MAG: DUF2795 domain-containing protein [Chloroflexota bacterium]|jgi:hypothetical protein